MTAAYCTPPPPPIKIQTRHCPDMPLDVIFWLGLENRLQWRVLSRVSVWSSVQETIIKVISKCDTAAGTVRWKRIEDYCVCVPANALIFWIVYSELLQIIHPEARSTQTPSILVVVVTPILFKIVKWLALFAINNVLEYYWISCLLCILNYDSYFMSCFFCYCYEIFIFQTNADLWTFFFSKNPEHFYYAFHKK